MFDREMKYAKACGELDFPDSGRRLPFMCVVFKGENKSARDIDERKTNISA